VIVQVHRADNNEAMAMTEDEWRAAIAADGAVVAPPLDPTRSEHGVVKDEAQSWPA
jgi:hypothetical protein